VRHRTKVLAAVLVAFAGCQHALAAQRRAAKNEHNANVPTWVEGARAKATNAVGVYRWYSGMQMGLFWASVMNKRQEALRFVAHNEEGLPVGWEPYIELADRKLPGGDGMLNLVVAGKSVTFNYTVEDGKPEIEGFASDGTDNTSLALNLIRRAAGKPVCLEFPEIDYVTCFSTKGATQAMKPDAWLP
jgi:hypothetical protein